MDDMRNRRIADRLVVGAAIVLVVAVGADAVRHHRSGRGAPATAPLVRTTTAAQLQSEMGGLPAARVPLQVRLVPSSTAFLRRCGASRASLALLAGPRLVLRYSGPPCHLPPLGLRAVLRWHDGKLLYDGAATAPDALAGNYADGSRGEAPLLGAASICGARATISGGGLATAGTVRCR
jgi:hypothetical protein